MNSVLNDREIKKLFDQGEKIVDPFDEKSLKPASIDLRMGNIHYQYHLDHYVLGEKIDKSKVEKKEFESLLVKPGESVFVGLKEKLSIPKSTMGIVFPRSSITRLGIQIVSTYMNPGYLGYMPLTVINHAGYPIELKPWCRVAQLVLFSLNECPAIPYEEDSDTKYYDERVKSSKLHTDYELNSMIEDILQEQAPILHKMTKEPHFPNASDATK